MRFRTRIPSWGENPQPKAVGLSGYHQCQRGIELGGGPNSVIKEHHTIHQWNEGWRELLKKGMGPSVQSVSQVRLFATPRTAACQASLSINNSRCLLKLMSIELVMLSNHLILCCPLLLPPSIFPSIRVFSKFSFWSQFFTSGGRSVGVSASASVLPMNIQDWFPLWLTGSISLQSKGLSRMFSNTTVQKHQFFGAQLSL